MFGGPPMLRPEVLAHWQRRIDKAGSRIHFKNDMAGFSHCGREAARVEIWHGIISEIPFDFRGPWLSFLPQLGRAGAVCIPDSAS